MSLNGRCPGVIQPSNLKERQCPHVAAGLNYIGFNRCAAKTQPRQLEVLEKMASSS